MKICFLHPGSMVFNMDTPFQQALGGTESALVYLAIQLAGLGHQVTVLSNTPQGGVLRGVTNLNYQLNTNPAFFHRESFDLVVVINACRMANDYRTILPAHSKLAVWITLDIDQPPVQSLLQSTIRNAWDFFILISEYQRTRFVNYLHLDLEKCLILRNAISPNFENLFSSIEELASAKHAQGAPRLAYTSTPFRGLEILMDIYPEFEHQFPAARLQVYSNMSIYQKTEAQQESWLLELYERCRNTRAVDYIGPIPQPELARALRGVSILAYPCTFAETSCIAVMEAMASGCLVVTSEFGALPETVNRFSQLVPIAFHSVEEFAHDYAQSLAAVYTELAMHPETMLAHLWDEVQFANSHYTWSIRAQEWTDSLTEMFTSRLSSLK